MSQYCQNLLSGETVLYGWDGATGGFFFSIEDKENEQEIFSENFILLSQLEILLKEYNIDYKLENLIRDFKLSNLPSNLQLRIAKMFNKDPIRKRDDCLRDIIRNYSKYLG